MGFELTGGFIQWRIRPKTKKSRLVGWIHWRRLQPRRELLRDREPPLPKDVWTTVTSYGLKVANELENLNLGLLGSTFELSFFFPKIVLDLGLFKVAQKIWTTWVVGLRWAWSHQDHFFPGSSDGRANRPAFPLIYKLSSTGGQT